MRTLVLLSTLIMAPIAVASTDNIIVAQRGTASVTLQEVDAMVFALPKHLRAGYLDSPERIQQLISNMLLEKQTAQKLTDYPTGQDPYYETRRQLANTRFEAEWVRGRVAEQIEENVPNMQSLAQERYQANPSKFLIPATLTLRHVLIKAKNRSDEDAQAIAETVRDLMRAGELSDDELVAKYTEEMSNGKPSDGYLRGVRPGTTVQPFEEAVFKMAEVNEVSDVIKTQYGYHVVRLIKREEAVQRAFAEVQDQIIDELKKEYTERMRANFDDALRNQDLRADPALLQSLRTRYQNAAENELEPEAVPDGLR